MAEILQQDVYDIVGQSFLDYSLSVITDRALPNIIDGLKPVQRKVLYSMWENNLTPSANFHKCATTVGHVIGSYSPHGDTSTYEALVNMSQAFNMRYPLIDFSGNNGSIDGDPPAAYRYTESKLSPIGYAMLENLDKDTVEFIPNFDNTKTEPITLSGYICDLLINGCSGIAVGMACNLVPHNLNEVYDALIYYIDCINEDKDIDQEQLFSIIKGPDFPLGGTITGTKGIRDYMLTGNGSVTVRADYVEETEGNKNSIVFTNLPYKINKADLVSHIDNLIDSGALPEAKEVRDESSKDDIVRIVVELKKNANKDMLLNKLYHKTKLQSNISVNNTVLMDGKPVVANLDLMLRGFLGHSITVTQNYINYENNKLMTRLNVVNGILRAADNIDRVVSIIKESEQEFEDLKSSGIFENDEQIQAILDMPLKNISKLNKNKYTSQKNELETKHNEFEKLLTDDSELLKYIKDKYLNIKKRFGDARRTTIEFEEAISINDEDLIMEEQIVLSYSTNDIVKCVSETEYKSQKRNGRGVSQNVNEADGDMIKKIITMSNKDDIMFFTNTGRCHILKGYEIPKTGKNARGKHINNYLKLDHNEQVINLVTADTEDLDNYLVFVTKKGMIKRMSFENLPKRGVGSVVGLVEDDSLADVCVAPDNARYIMVTANGMALAVDGNTVRPSGRAARGVKGMKIKDGDAIVKVIAEPITEEDTEHYILTVTENGYAKRTGTNEFNSKGRGCSGVRAHKITDASGKIVTALVAEDGASILASTKNGQMIRTPMDGFRSQGRVAGGVSLMKLEDNDSIASVTVLYSDEENTVETVEESVEKVTITE